jgi:hypothetical protein
VDEEDELPLGVEASINLDAFDPEDLDDEELVEGEDILASPSVASSAFFSTVREVWKSILNCTNTLSNLLD